MSELSLISSKRPYLKSLFDFGFLFLLCIGTLSGYAQGDRGHILTLRKASNQALKVFDHVQFLSYLTEDVHITTGNGTLIQGKERLRAYLAEAVGSRIYFVGTPLEVEVNDERGLAWETGTWQGYDPELAEKAITGGKYSAQWKKTNGEWRIRAELFVTVN